MIVREFSNQGVFTKEEALKKAESIPDNSKPHHSFHVLVIGSVTGTISLQGKLLDVCRVSWGEVVKISDKIVVKYKPILNNSFQKEIEKTLSWDKKIVSGLKIGDMVSFHWNNVIQVLNQEDIDNLEKYTQFTLNT